MSSLLNLNLGSMIKLWRDSRGHDYVFVAVDESSKEALFIRANCINQDGSVRANSKGFHKRLPYSQLGDIKVVKNVTRILGTKPLNVDVIEKHIVRFADNEHVRIVKKNKPEFKSLPVVDARQPTLYL
jgi:hypothetical protein